MRADPECCLKNFYSAQSLAVLWSSHFVWPVHKGNSCSKKAMLWSSIYFCFHSLLLFTSMGLVCWFLIWMFGSLNNLPFRYFDFHLCAMLEELFYLAFNIYYVLDALLSSNSTLELVGSAKAWISVNVDLSPSKDFHFKYLNYPLPNSSCFNHCIRSIAVTHANKLK